MLDDVECLRRKLLNALSMKEASERIFKKSANTDSSFHACYKSLALSTRLANYYDSQLKRCEQEYQRLQLASKDGEKVDVPCLKPIESECCALLIISIPILVNDQYKTRKNDYKSSIHAYIEITYNDDVFQTDPVEIDQNMRQIITFKVELVDIDPETILHINIYSWVYKTSDLKKSLGGSRKQGQCNHDQMPDEFDLYGTYETSIIKLIQNNCFEFDVKSTENVLINYMEYSKVASATISIFPKKYKKFLTRNKVVIISVKEILNMEDNGDEFSFLTMYWNIENGNLKFYFDIYLSKCLNTLTTSLNEIENISKNDAENELIITSTTHIITLMIENTNTLHLTLETIEKVMTIGQSWPSSLIMFPRSTVCFLKNALLDSPSFFDTIGTPISRQSTHYP